MRKSMPETGLPPDTSASASARPGGLREATQRAMGRRLNDQEVSRFLKDGYVLVPQLFDAPQMGQLLQYARQDETLIERSHVRVDAQGAETRLSLSNELRDSCPYSAIVRSDRVAKNMQRLLEDEVYHFHHKMMLKEPRTGGAWEWHQDYGYWYEYGCLYPDMASCMLAIDRATKDNGCLQVLQGSHRMGRLNHARAGHQSRADPTRVEAASLRHELVYCEMEPGDALFFHSNLLHRSDSNRSEAPRWSLISCFNTRHNDPFTKESRHPHYTPLETWDDQRVLTLLNDCSS